MLTFESYSDLCLYLDNHDYDIVLDYDDFTVVKIQNQYFFQERYYTGSADDFFEVNLIAELTYTIHDDLQVEGGLMDTLFHADCCGEQVLDDCIKYLWFKRKE